MGLDSIINKAKSTLAGKDGKLDGKDFSGAKDAYSTFNLTDGSVTDKAKAAYAKFESREGNSDTAADKTESTADKTESTADKKE